MVRQHDFVLSLKYLSKTTGATSAVSTRRKMVATAVVMNVETLAGAASQGIVHKIGQSSKILGVGGY